MPLPALTLTYGRSPIMKAKRNLTTTGTLSAADRRILDAVKAAKTALTGYRVLCREVHRLYREAQCHPDYPETQGEFWRRRARGEPQTPVSNEAFRAADRAKQKVWRAVGYDVASDNRNQARSRLRPMLRRICRLRPRIVGALSAKAALFKMAVDVDFWDDDDFMEYAVPVLLADLAHLAERRPQP